MIYGAVKEQKLKIKAQAAADTIDYLTARFTFLTADWDGLTKYAHFTKGTERYSVQLTDDEIKESDHLNLGQGEWQIYLHGNEYRNGEVIKRVTTNIETFTVEPTGVLSGDPFPEAEPSVVEQLAAQVSDHEDRIESLETQVEGLVKDVKTADGTSVVDENGVAHLPEAKTEMTEIKKSGNTANFTASEIAEMQARNTPMCYDGTPVSSILILTLAGGAKEAYLGILYTGTTVQEAQTLKINENKQITTYENGTTLTDAERTKLAQTETFTAAEKTKLGGIETGAEKNTVIDVLDSDGNSVVGTDRKARLPQSGGGTITDVQDEQGNSLVSEGIATIPSEVVEIIRSYQLAYTPSEVETMFRTKELKISGKTVVDIYSYGTGVSLNTQIYFIDRDDGEEYLYYNEYSYNGTTISTRNKVGRWSEANYTSTEKNKLSGIATGAEVNVIDTIKDSNGNALPVTNKEITLPAPPSVPVTDVQDSNGNSLVTSGVAQIPAIPDISGKEDTANKVTSLSSSSTDTEYPSAKAVYDFVDSQGGGVPSGTNAGDILVWNGSAWAAKPAWQMKYTPVDWIKSSGTQYIDTLLKANAVETVIIDFEIGNTGSWQTVYGVRSYGTTKSNILFVSNTDKQIRVDYSVTPSSSNIEQLVTLGQSLWGRRAKIKIEKTLSGINVYDDDVLIYNTTFSGSSWESEYNQTIFVLNDNGNKITYATDMKLYSAQFFINNVLVRDFKPCTQNATGVAGLYETVEEKFYVNSGTGNFIIPT